MRQNKVRLSESKLRSIIREAVKSVLMEDGRYMSDEDIANQYKDMKITYFRIEPLRFSPTSTLKIFSAFFCGYFR